MRKIKKKTKHNKGAILRLTAHFFFKKKSTFKTNLSGIPPVSNSLDPEQA